MVAQIARPANHGAVCELSAIKAAACGMRKGQSMPAPDDQHQVIAFLSDAGNLGEKGPVERIETHAAIVFLAGAHAFKLKKAVHYPYLDFSSVEKREAVCRAELELNRRTAPELYLDVRSINRQADGTLGFGEGEALDWIVWMRRFADEDLLDAVARRSGLDAPLLRALADHIARFHDEAAIHSGTDGAARIARVIDGNRASMAGLPEGALPRADCDRLHVRSIARLEELSSLLDQRARRGAVRRCHGDLHLANICLFEGKPMLFDCLEFDEELATTDVLYDLAFLLMDLWVKGWRNEASLVFNRYLDRREETDGIAAMGLFLSMRAAIRAHVGATAAAGIEEEARRARKLAAARSYLEAALAFLETRPPRLVAVGGLSGSGKSTLAGLLAPQIGGAPGARWLRSDVIRKLLAGEAPETRLPAEAYTPERNAEVYGKLLADCRSVLAAGHAVIVDGVFARPGEREQLSTIARETGAGFTGIWLEAPPGELFARVEARKNDASDADRGVVERQLTYELGDLSGWQKVAAKGSPEEVLARVRRLL
jgi:aminoglycoside phosphotransferase family enzyme/predicted kinase